LAAIRRRFSCAATAATALAVTLLSGCALLPAPLGAARGGDGTSVAAGAAVAAAGPASAAASAPPAATVKLDISAPAALVALLGLHLDLARLQSLGDDAALDDSEIDRLVAAVPAQARELLQTEGYFDAQVEARVEARPAGEAPPAFGSSASSPARVRIEVVAGPRSRVGTLQLSASGELDRRLADGQADAKALFADLRKTWPLRAGSPFRNDDWVAAKAQTLERLRSAGYAAGDIADSGAEVDTAAQSVALRLSVASGPRFLVGAVHVEGLSRQDEAIALGLIQLSPGQPLTEAALLDVQERLRKAGLYEAVSVTFNPDPEQAVAAAVTVQLREAALQQATVGAGYSANSGQRLTLEHTHRRVFGLTATAYNKFEWGRDKQFWQGDLTSHPDENNRRYLLGGQFERDKSANDVVLSQRLRIGSSRDVGRAERLVYAELLHSRQDGAILSIVAQAASLNFNAIWRDLDNPLLPTRGLTASLQSALGDAGSQHGASGPFGRLYGRVTGYLPLGGSWYGQARAEAGQIFKSDAVIVPDALGFRAGGDESVRGYPYRSLSPLQSGTNVGGSVMATGSVEVAHPISAAMPALWGAIFFDAGRAATNWAAWSPARGYGFGVRWRSPVGPLRVDWAWGSELRRGRLHLSVGIAF
jgi:translocation and assembly module TamA